MKSFELAKCQLETGALHGFYKYLILERHSGAASVETCLIVPEGSITSKENCASITCSTKCGDSLRFHKFPVHQRYNTLQSPNRLARLRLAAIHAATSLAICDDRYGKTGLERAAELLRQFWTSSALSNEELRWKTFPMYAAAGTLRSNFSVKFCFETRNEYRSFIET